MLGILILAGCDADLKFHLFSAQNSGSTNDVVAWEMSALKAVQDNGLIPSKYFFIGDEAFNNGPQFLVPYSGSGIGSEKDSFNYHLSSMRQCINVHLEYLPNDGGYFGDPSPARTDDGLWSVRLRRNCTTIV